MILHWNDGIFECDMAVKTSNKILLYDSNYELIREIFNISPSKWNEFELEGGTWTDQSEIPTDFDHIQADLDFLQMENDALTGENEQLRADVDYCLMLLDGGTNNGSE